MHGRQEQTLLSVRTAITTIYMKSRQKLFDKSCKSWPDCKNVRCPSVFHTRHEQRSEAANVADSRPPHSCIRDEVQNDNRARTAHFSSQSASILSKLPPSTLPRRQAQYQSVCIQLHHSGSYSAYNRSTDVPCMGPCAGINRKMCQP